MGWWCRRAAESVESEMKGLREVRVEREREGEREWGGGVTDHVKLGDRAENIGKGCALGLFSVPRFYRNFN